MTFVTIQYDPVADTGSHTAGSWDVMSFGLLILDVDVPN